MANVNAPNGFKPVRHLAGGLIRLDSQKIASGLSSDIFEGDVVKLLNTGYLDKAAAGDTNMIGIFHGVQYVATDGSIVFSNKWVASTATQGSADVTAWIYRDPMITYEVQCLTGTNFAQTHIGNNAPLNYSAGNSTTGVSKSSIDISSAAATANDFRILNLIPRPDNAVGDSARVEVRFDRHIDLATAGI